ncbi:AIPR protein [Plasticicumulans lactativorans]|uniref:AIPR protein n=1 Tax=Plasticicumulans lactativorans TaxID=1133106 RepID=A0A4R2KXL8_9GAMM|nr:AIPR family protein [Plasticicumulans lactativorans]TCO76036.1 AIPR protein [Plasticicumulans lactativorans]
MAALESQYMTILKKVLADRFVPFLPPLLGNANPTDQAAKQLSRAFSAFVLHKLLDITPQVAAASVVDDFNDKGIDAIHYHAPSETLYLLQTKLKESEQFKQDEANAFCEGVRLLLNQDFAVFNANVQARQAEIEGALDACSHIQLVVPYTGDGVSTSATDALDVLLNDDDLDEERLAKTVRYYTADDITRDLLGEQAYRPVHAEISLHKHQKVESPKATYYGIVRLADLVALHKKEGKALYERNIRYFLGSSKSDINKAIKATLHDRPEDFFYLNNGVTAVCDQVDPKGKNPTNGARKFKVRGLSIINGAQTVASASEFVDQHPGTSIDGAKVMLTLIKAAAEGEFGKRVTKARNHQNPVQSANFASLDDNQERLRQEIAHLGFEYHYRPEAMTNVGVQAITLDEALRALALLQNDPRYPVWLKSDPARLADPDSAEYQALFTPQLTGAALINAVLCYRAIRILMLANEQMAPARSQERLVYRHGGQAITAVMMKRLRRRINGANAVDANTIPHLVSQPLDQLRQEAAELAKDRLKFEGPLAYFRNLERTVPFLIDLMKNHFGLVNFQTETNPEKLHKLAAEKKTLAQDLAERLSVAAPQI